MNDDGELFVSKSFAVEDNNFVLKPEICLILLISTLTRPTDNRRLSIRSVLITGPRRRALCQQ